MDQGFDQKIVQEISIDGDKEKEIEIKLPVKISLQKSLEPSYQDEQNKYFGRFEKDIQYDNMSGFYVTKPWQTQKLKLQVEISAKIHVIKQPSSIKPTFSGKEFTMDMLKKREDLNPFSYIDELDKQKDKPENINLEKERKQKEATLISSNTKQRENFKTQKSEEVFRPPNSYFSHQIAKIKGFWRGNNTYYPNIYKRILLKNFVHLEEQVIEESIDYSKKRIM